MSHVGSHLGLFVLKAPKTASFSSPPSLGAQKYDTMLVEKVVSENFKFIWRGALGTICYNASGTSGVDNIST